MKLDYSKYYFLEGYLFDEVTNNFRKRKYLTLEEFFCIVIWKANRAKSKIKNKILKKRGSLESNIKKLTEKIYKTRNNEEKLRILLEEWDFGLPMATAILTVLYPDIFSVYDIRVRNQLGIKDFSGRKDEIEKYFNEFLPVVTKQAGKSLRDKDRYLWGKDFYNALVKFIKSK